MGFSESFFAARFGITRGDLESYLAEALSHGGDYADVYFEYLSTSHISIDESIIKSAAEDVSPGVGVRGVAGKRTAYAYSGDRRPGKRRIAARGAAGRRSVDMRGEAAASSCHFFSTRSHRNISRAKRHGRPLSNWKRWTLLRAKPRWCWVPAGPASSCTKPWGMAWKPISTARKFQHSAIASRNRSRARCAR